jgi:hypothetical protein
MTDTDGEAAIPTVEAEGEAIEERNLNILYSLHEETTEAFRALVASQYTSSSDQSYRVFVASLTTEISYLEPSLRETGHLHKTDLGRLEHAGGTVEFQGLASVVDHADGVHVAQNRETIGRGSNSEPVATTVPVPQHVLKNAYRALNDWFDTVGLGLDLRDGTDEWDI